jgi:GT2 family glycosyltransferase
MTTAAVILNWNRAALTDEAARSVRDQVDALYLVDNDSAPDDAANVEQLARELDGVFLRLDANCGYAGGNTAGVAAALEAGHDRILVLNNDVVVRPGAVAVLEARLAERAGLAACAPVVVSCETGEVLHSTCELDLDSGSFGWLDHLAAAGEIDTEPRPTGYVSGEAFLVRAEVVRECGMFDERFFLTFEDTEWSARVRRAGWALETCGAAVVEHHHGATMGGVTSAFYKTRNYPLFLHLALDVPPPVALFRGTGFALRGLAYQLKRRRWAAALKGVARGWAASGPMLAKAGGSR